MMKKRFFGLSLWLVGALSGMGCDDNTTTPGTDAGAPLEMSELFGPCVDDSQCPGAGAICRAASEGFPGGYCTIPCSDRTPCDALGVYHHCLQRGDEEQTYCERRCLNGLDCGREGWTCAGEYPPSGGACLPVCSNDEMCGEGAACNNWTGECTAESIPETGAVTGDPCTDTDACRSGQCIQEETDTGVLTGWVGGYCVSNCILPVGYNTNDFFAGDALPQAGCPGDAICLPLNFGAASQRDLGRCYFECMSDSDCRGGYRCLKEFELRSGVQTYSNGLCVPADCETAGCPDGYECRTLNEGTANERVGCARI